MIQILFYASVSITTKAQIKPFHEINFCGEVLPISKKYVAENYLNVVKKLIKHKGNVPAMYQRAMLYFPVIIPILRHYGIPDDFKYVAVIESNFKNITSSAGAAGVWQIMEVVSQDIGGIKIDKTKGIDEREDIIKSTICACKYFIFLYKRLHSWTLVAAAYNGGIGMISRKIKKAGTRDYYLMSLNKETAEYGLKISAVKELFENHTNLEKVLFNKNYKIDTLKEVGKIRDTDKKFNSINLH